MGGGPRTFPGGINKWQWKRLHEKKAREKEKRLLDQEKQLYQARVRSDIRAKVAAAENPSFGGEKPDQNQPNHGPLTPEEHIKALADRFMKEGAEDLWNENDERPVNAPINQDGERRPSVGELIDLQKVFAESSSACGGEKIRRGDFSGNVGAGVANRRMFSTYSRCGDGLMGVFGSERFGRMNNGLNLLGNYRDVSNLSNLNCYYSVVAGGTKSKRSNFVRDSKKSVVKDGLKANVSTGGSKKSKWPKYRGRGVNSDDDDSDDYDNDEDDDDEDMGSDKKILGSIAALGEYDRKTMKRGQWQKLEDKVAFSQEVAAIREQMKRWNSSQDEGKDEEEPVISTKRLEVHHLCNVESYNSFN